MQSSSANDNKQNLVADLVNFCSGMAFIYIYKQRLDRRNFAIILSPIKLRFIWLKNKPGVSNCKK